MNSANAYQYEYTPPQTYREILESAGGFWSNDFAEFCTHWHTVLIPSDDYGHMHGVVLDLPVDLDPQTLISFKLPKPAFRAGYKRGDLFEEYKVSVVRHFSQERVNKIGISDSGHIELYITETGRIITFSDGSVGAYEVPNTRWGDAIESALYNQNWVLLGNAIELEDTAKSHLEDELKKLESFLTLETTQTPVRKSRPVNRTPYMSWEKRIHLDRWIAGALLLGGIWVALDLPFNLSSPHHLWDLPFVRVGIYPLGILVSGFWLFRLFNLGSINLWRIGWWISILWHAGWIIFLIVSLIGLVVMMAAVPWHLVWLFSAFFGSLLGLHENRCREADLILLKLANAGHCKPQT